MENNEINFTAMSREEIKACRHKAEVRWYRRLVFLNIVIILAVIGSVFAMSRENSAYFKELAGNFKAVQAEIAFDESDSESTDTEASSVDSTSKGGNTSSTSKSHKKSKGSDYGSGYSDGYDDGFFDGYDYATYGDYADDSSDYAISDDSYDDADSSYDDTDDYSSYGSDDSEMASEDLEETISRFPESLKLLLIGIFTIISLPFVLSYMYAQYRSMSVMVTERNFPEIYAIVKEYSQKLGLKRVPKVYLIQGNGVLNAFSAFIPFKQYIELYADLVEVAYREYEDMESLKFIIGHEMAHIRLKHATLHYNLNILFSSLIPILGSTASRAREYSCDRIAQRLSGNDGIEAIMALTAGIHLYKRVDVEDYIEQARNVKGLFVWAYNLASDHPVTSKRVLALEMKEGSGKLY